jgi:Holliday junction resolvase RusA-like endonuclease
MNPILNITIPGEPIAQERHRWGAGHNYDPNAKDKKVFQWLVKSAAPMLVPSAKRLGVIFEVWTSKGNIKTGGDWDNFGKFICDALNGLAWLDDSQIDDGRVVVHRGAQEPRVELLVWERGKDD